MARGINKLSPAKVAKASKPGLYGDGVGLWLHVGPTGGKSWLFRYMLNGRAREMGLGPLYTIGLAEAREKARQCRQQLLEGIDPLGARQAARDAARAAAARAVTFADASGRYIAAHRAGWRNDKHAAQWTATLETYAYPVIGSLPVAAIDTGHVTRILEPIWATKTETAGRVRGRIEAILDYAKTHGWRTGENPARWKGHLANVLPARGKVQKVAHHAAIDRREMGEFLAVLRQRHGVAARAAEFCILTAARSSEARGARWGEIDMQAAVWAVPAERMKAGREHRVPLSDAALAVLDAMPRDGELVFPGAKAGQPLSDVALSKIVKLAAGQNVTLHGMRSAFRDWAAETGKPGDLAEAALAHTTGDKTVQAYLCGDLFERRRRLMDQWAEFCAASAPAEKVVALRPKQSLGAA